MGFVDAQTMIKFKNKVEKRLDEKQAKKNVHVACALNIKFDTDFSTPLLKGKQKYKPESSYWAASGNSKKSLSGFVHYLCNGNGNRFKASPNDYIHQRKRYLNHRFDSEKDEPDWEDLLRYLFGNDLVDMMKASLGHSFSKSSFPRVDNPNSTLKLTIEDRSETIVNTVYLDSSAHIPTDFNEYEAETFTRWRGKLYIVENPYERDGNDGKFCESVFACLNLIISMNPDQNTTDFYISCVKG